MKTDPILLETNGDFDVVSTKKRNIHPLSFLRGKAYNVIYQKGSFYLPQIRGFIEDEVISDIFPDYLRCLEWDNVKKSKLIESFLLNIPISPICLFETKGLSGYEVLDGQQRINAINGFYSNEFELSGLESIKPLNGYKYSDCADEIKLTLDRSIIPAYTILYEEKSNGVKNSLDIRHNLFERLNSGGTQLSPHQLRVVAFPSHLNEVFELASQNDHFKTAFDIPISPQNTKKNSCLVEQNSNIFYSRMEDCELVLRFFTLRENTNVFTLSSEDLDAYMKRNIDIDKSCINDMVGEFNERFELLYDLFGEKPFDIVNKEIQNFESRKLMYELSMLAVDELWNEREEISNDINGIMNRLWKSDDGAHFQTVISERDHASLTYCDKVNLFKQILKPESKR